MRKIFRINILIFFLLIYANIFGQGSLEGIVTDLLTHESLIGANVYLKGTALGAAVSIEGEYRISQVSEGKYTVIISYVGYEQKRIDVNIFDNKTAYLFIELRPADITGEEVVVSAQALGQAAAINQQLNSNTIVNIISEQKIQELPDANAAEAIGRLPGVALGRDGGEANKVVLRGLSSKFSTITIDGVRITATDENSRGVDLSTISQGTLAGIELFKALTSDMDADAIAGTVNLVTKSAPSDRIIRIDAKGAFNEMDNSASQYNFGVRYGERFFNNILGVQATGNIERTIRSNEYYTLGYDQSIDNYTNYHITTLGVRYANEIRERSGASLLLDLDTPDNGWIKFNNIFNQTSRDNLTTNRGYPANGGVEYNYRDINIDISTFNSSLRGKNYFLGLEATWGISYSQSKYEIPLDWYLAWNEASGMKDGEVISGMKNVPENLLQGPVSEWTKYATNNFNIASISTGIDRGQDRFTKDQVAHLNFLKQYNLATNVSGIFKFGGKVSSQSRNKSSFLRRATYDLEGSGKYVKNDDNQYVLKDFTGTPFAGLEGAKSVPLAPFLDSPINSRNIYDSYLVNPMINRDKMKLWRELNLKGYSVQNEAGAEFLNDILNNSGNYNILERVYSGYLMATLNFGQDVTLIAGVRVEQDDHEFSGKYSKETLGMSGVTANVGELIDVDASHVETNWLPNFHAIIKPTEFWNVKFATYKALARPDFNRRLPKYIALIASSKSLEIGNVDLKNAKAWNFEIQNQFYGNTIGLFSINVFYKEIEDMFLTLDRIQTEGSGLLDSLDINWQRYVDEFEMPNTYNLSTQYNSDKLSKVWGLEIEHQGNTRFLPGLWKNITFGYNFSIVRSETWITGEKAVSYKEPGSPFPRVKIVVIDKKEKMADQPEFFANAYLGYDYEGFSARLSLFYQGEYNTSFSADSRSDNVRDSFTRWDIALKQKITDQLSVFFNVNNITDVDESSSIVNRIENRQLLRNSSRYGRTADLGVRIDL